MGYYGGLGARKVATVTPAHVAAVPAELPERRGDRPDRLRQLGVSGSWAVPANAVSGIYFAKLVRSDTGGASHIFFIVRNDASTLGPAVPDRRTPPGRRTTPTAATACTPARRRAAPTRSATTVRSTRAVVDNGQDWVFNAEYPMVRWLEANGYDVSYFSGVDADRLGSLLLNHKVFVSVGHDEYWSGGAARQCRGGPRCGREPGVLQRQRGLLEDPLGEQHRRLAARPTARWCATRRRTPTQRSIPIRRLDRHLARPALQPAGRRRPARERADRHDLHGQRCGHRHPSWCRRATARCASGATPASPPGAGPDRHAADRHAGLRVGRRRSTTASGPPA